MTTVQKAHVKPAEHDQYVRFNVSQRLEHLLMMITFTLLVITGVPQKFFGAGWAQSTILAMGGIETIRFVHRSAAAIFVLEGAYHAGYLFWLIARGRFVPSMIPGMKDAKDAVDSFRYCIGLRPKMPKFDRFDYRQKFEYWGVLMGWAIMVVTGLILVFPIQATQLLPGVFVPASKEMHGGEALLAFGVIVIWHLYGAHFNPLRFPGDTTIFTGKISVERMIEEHPLEYERATGFPLEEEEPAKEVKRPPVALAHGPQPPSQ